MCDREECICNICRRGPCGMCDYNGLYLNECRTGGLHYCFYFRGSWVKNIVNGIRRRFKKI